jgi:hypothetical protein
MSVNKKSISSQALAEMNEIKNAIKEESKNTIKAMLSEAVKNALRESIDEEDDDMVITDGDEDCCPKCGKCGDECKCEKKDADGKDDKKSDKKDSGELDEVGEDEQVPAEDGAVAQDPAMNAQPAAGAQAAPAEGEGAEGQDDFMAQYQAGDEDTLDLTGEQDIQNVLKVYRALSDDDQVVVKQDGGKISLQDNGTGAEYIIDLGTDDAEPAMEDGEADQLAEESYVGASDKYNELAEEENNELEEPEMTNEETLFEIDLGYTDNYQDKDPIDGLNNSEPSKSGRSWHKGIPTGTEKPWAGKGTEKKGDPFDKSVNENFTELDDKYFAAGLNDTGVAEVETEDGMPFDKKVGNVDENFTTSKYQKRHEVKTKATNSGDKEKPMQTRNTSIENEYNAEINETIKKLKAKNKKLNEAVKELHKGLKEAYMTNVNLGKITKLFLESTTTQAEKLQIVERFSNEAKTPKQAQALYESISKELAKKTTVDESKVTEKTVVTESKAPVYKSQDLLNTIDLMNRVLNC